MPTSSDSPNPETTSKQPNSTDDTDHPPPEYFLSPIPLNKDEVVKYVLANYQASSYFSYVDEVIKQCYERRKKAYLASAEGRARGNTGPHPAVACLSKYSDDEFQTMVRNRFRNSSLQPKTQRRIFPAMRFIEKSGLSEKAGFPCNGTSNTSFAGFPHSAHLSVLPLSDKASSSTSSSGRNSSPLGTLSSIDDPSSSRSLSDSIGQLVKVESDKLKKQLENDNHDYIQGEKLPPKNKSRIFLSNITCIDTGTKYTVQSSRSGDDFYFRSRTDSSDLPFSILTIQEQRDFLKRSGEAFVQDAPCYEISKMYGVETSGPLFGGESWCKCRECRSAKQKESLAVFCRFYGFRKLRFINNQLCTSGFLLPEDCTENDLRLWLPRNLCFTENSGKEDDLMTPGHLLDSSMSNFILARIGNQFCELVAQEKKALSWVNTGETIYWKRPVAGVREMCDVCETTLFNMHWVCPKCGFGVCLDCYERRMDKSTAEQEVYDSEKMNYFRWLRCAKGKNHFHSSLLPIQIIPSTCLWDLNDMVHNVRKKNGIRTRLCPCQKEKEKAAPTPLLKRHITDGKVFPKFTEIPNVDLGETSGEDTKSRKRPAEKTSPVDWLASIELHERKSKERKLNKSSQSLPPCGKRDIINLTDLIAKRIEQKKVIESRRVTEGASSQTDSATQKMEDMSVAKAFPRLDAQANRKWLCDGKLLQLTDSLHPKNLEVFKVHWQYGMPVLVSGVGKYLNMDLWHPSTLSREYGDENSKNSLVNCLTGSIVTNMKIRDFWDGFENISQRLLDEKKKTMILKLKDWPPTLAFHDVMPEMFQDLMKALPLPEYTNIAGKCNLASRLPHFFVKPDLGPKMYNAYGWVTESDWRQGTTNLHLDISDAVNIMVYVGIPVDEPPEARSTLLQIVKEGEVDDMQFQRALSDKPGALWHIFHQQDTNKIRDLIKKVCAERGETLLPDHDPIHDQQMYLDKELRHRLREEYGVEGYAILQCQGDGVFIPAGAPHQVFNLHSCVKIAEDFVSPEHVGQCFTLTNEFRYLSSTHSNHEDKLQIKNIIYHSIKDIVSSAIHVHCVES